MEPQTNQFINIEGYSLTAVREMSAWWMTVCEFHLKDPALAFLCKGEYRVEPNRHYFTDMGSVGRLLGLAIPKDRYLLAFLLHDSGYTFGGFWIDGGFVKFTRKQVDDLLYYMILVDPVKPLSSALRALSAKTIWLGVRIGGASFWKKADLSPKKRG